MRPKELEDATLTVSDWGEKRIIREIIAPLSKSARLRVGVGDDAAVVNFPPGQHLVISSDKIPEDLLSIQFGLMDPFHHGRYLAMVNLSDVGAMGAKPLGLLSTLALPNDFSLSYLWSFFEGFVAGGAEWDTPVVGGDTGWASAICLSATAFGSIESGREIKRSGAKVGDRLFVTGNVGGFGAALAYFGVAKRQGLSLEPAEEEWLKSKLIKPIAKIDIGQKLSASGDCTSCMDITDGLYQSLVELVQASQVKIVIDYDMIPIHPTVRKVSELIKCPIETIIFGIGLDLELVGTITGHAAISELGVHLFGTVEDGPPEVVLKRNNKIEKISTKGWQHFSGSAMDIVTSMYSSK
ncbi:thiamine-phosphate kinase [Methylobacterium nonmethylotrophicum]|nr:thiamine-phosphate kinase [Methylobacterium nonmethylotrophicum]